VSTELIELALIDGYLCTGLAMWWGTEDGGHAWRWRWRNKGARVQLGGWMDDWMRGGVKRVTADGDGWRRRALLHASF